LKQLTSKVDDIQLSVADRQTGGTPVGGQIMVRPSTLVASQAAKSRSMLATGNGTAKDTANDTVGFKFSRNLKLALTVLVYTRKRSGRVDDLC
jgi:hypothetical protein